MLCKKTYRSQGRMLRIVGILSLLLTFYEVGAQGESCTARLQAAEDAYQAGKMRQVVGLLEACVGRKGLDKEDRISALSLLTRAYLVLDLKTPAQHNMIELLSLEPEYQVPVGEMDMLYLYGEIRTRPFAYWSTRVGGHLTDINFQSTLGEDGIGQKTEIVQQGINPSLFLGTELSFRLFSGLELGLEAAFQQYRWTRQTKVQSLSKVPDSTSINFDFIELENEEALANLQGTLMLRYRWFTYPGRGQEQRWNPYVFIGIGGQRLLNGQINTINRQTIVEDTSRAPVNQGANIGTFHQNADSSLRRAYNLSLIGGVGLSWKIGKTFLGLEARYTHLIYDTALIANRYTASSSPELLFSYGYLDESFFLRNLGISLDWTVPLYRPKLKK